MKKLIILILMPLVALCADAEVVDVVKKVVKGGSGDRVKIETKYTRFTAQRGGFVRYADYEVPEFKTSEALLGSAKIRQYMDIHTGKSTFFLMITVGRDKATEVVAYDDVVKVIDAVKVLKSQAEKDSIAGITLKCHYVTEDGFKIGYNAKPGKISWYFSVGGDERKFSKDFDFEGVLLEIRNRINKLIEENK